MSDFNNQENDDILTLTTDDGEDVDFLVIAEITIDSGYYLILQPVELPEDMDEDEALVFKVTVSEDNAQRLTIENNDAVVDAVFEEYGRLLEERA